ncbi:class F sortase [Nocardioides sediminis]|uniref:class F sortase n=1 Tax=Nocardioides sediminis TaxID=433648 RepID=UPI0018FF4704|nr:class F sortase [Nocardioides sediminis]
MGRSTWWAVAAVAVAGLLLSLVAVLSGDDPPAVEQVRGEASVSAAGPRDAAPSTAGPPSRGAVGRSDASLESAAARRTPTPVRVRVPGIGLDAAVQPVGVGAGRQMRLPADPRVLGWYRFGPAPGGDGSVVLAGHVDSRRFGVGPLAALQTIGVGDRVEVVTGPGSVRAYRVDSIERFSRQALPEDVFARTGPERLRLVTCTGPFVPDAGGYQQNLVVTAVPA